MFLTEINGNNLQKILRPNISGNLYSVGLGQIMLPKDQAFPPTLEQFVSNPISVSIDSLIDAIRNIDWIITQINSGVPRILIFSKQKESFNRLLRCEGNKLNVINYSSNEPIRWRFFYSKSKAGNNRVAAKLTNDFFAIVNMGSLAHHNENKFYELIVEVSAKPNPIENFISDLPKFSLIKEFYASIPGNENIDLQLIHSTSLNGFDYLTEATKASELGIVFLSNINGNKLVGEESDKFNALNLYETLLYFEPDFAYSPNFFDSIYDLNFFLNGKENTEFNKVYSDFISISHPISVGKRGNTVTK